MTDVAPETVDELLATVREAIGNDSLPWNEEAFDAALAALRATVEQREVGYSVALEELDVLRKEAAVWREIAELRGGERDEARASLVQLRSAWNAHFARCETPLVEGMTDEEFFKKLDEWKNAPSGTASSS